MPIYVNVDFIIKRQLDNGSWPRNGLLERELDPFWKEVSELVNSKDEATQKGLWALAMWAVLDASRKVRADLKHPEYVSQSLHRAEEYIHKALPEDVRESSKPKAGAVAQHWEGCRGE